MTLNSADGVTRSYSRLPAEGGAGSLRGAAAADGPRPAEGQESVFKTESPKNIRSTFTTPADEDPVIWLKATVEEVIRYLIKSIQTFSIKV